MTLDSFRHYVAVCVIAGYVGHRWGATAWLLVVLIECVVLPFVYGLGAALMEDILRRTKR